MAHRRSLSQSLVSCLGVVLLCVVLPHAAESAGQAVSRQAAGPNVSVGVTDYRSKNFLVHTDLPSAEAQRLLARLETMLGHMTRYWGRPNRKIVECYVVDRLTNWPTGAIDPRALPSIRANAGITLSGILTRGNRFSAKSRVYSVSRRGTPQHEAVHAYCMQTFGRTGPVWYSEGMAEVGNYWREKDSKAVHCNAIVVNYLRRSKPKAIHEIVQPRRPPRDSWQNYAWRWALCHLLGNNPNYAPRFRPLGLALLTGKPGVNFQRVYGPVSREVAFEYLFFLQHLERGFRVDLCSWDWKAKYRIPRGGSSVTVPILAGRGWQPSRLRVTRGGQYAYRAKGTWKTGSEEQPISADGRKDKTGRLMGIIFDDYTLSKPFEMGTYGTFTSPMDGKLLLRCRDRWNEIADNSGTIKLRLKIAGRGKPLSRPKQTGQQDAGSSKTATLKKRTDS